MRTLDASVLIAHLDARDDLHERAGELLSEAAGDQFAASVITIAEVLVAPARAGRLADAQAALAQLDVAALPLRAEAGPRLAELRAATGLKLPDCCVLLSAEEAGAEVVTLDARLGRAATQLGLG